MYLCDFLLNNVANCFVCFLTVISLTVWIGNVSRQVKDELLRAEVARFGKASINVSFFDLQCMVLQPLHAQDCFMMLLHFLTGEVHNRISLLGIVGPVPIKTLKLSSVERGLVLGWVAVMGLILRCHWLTLDIHCLGVDE